MPVIQATKDGFKELNDRATIVGPDGVQHPANVVSVWSDDALAKINIYRVARAEVPVGQRMKPGTDPRYEINKKTGRPYQVIDTEADPAFVPEPKGKKLKAATTKASTITEIRANALTEIDRRTLGNDIMILIVLEMKRAEAERFLDDTASKPDMAKYPFLSEAYSTKVEGKTATEIAKVWVRQSDDVRLRLAGLEAKRTQAYKAIRDANTKGDIDYVLDNFKG